MELRMPQGHKSHCLAAESEQELQDWLSKLQHVLQITRQQEEKPVGTLERGTVARIDHFNSSIVCFFFFFLILQFILQLAQLLLPHISHHSMVP